MSGDSDELRPDIRMYALRAPNAPDRSYFVPRRDPCHRAHALQLRVLLLGVQRRFHELETAATEAAVQEAVRTWREEWDAREQQVAADRETRKSEQAARDAQLDYRLQHGEWPDKDAGTNFWVIVCGVVCLVVVVLLVWFSWTVE